MKKPTPKSQHYVPRFYLRNFSQDDKVHVFSKKDGRRFLSNISGVAHENFFYKLPDFCKKSTPHRIKLNQKELKSGIEKHLSALENKFNKALNQFIEQIKSCKLKFFSHDESGINGFNFIEINQKMKHSLSHFFVLQDLRTREHKEITRQFYDRHLTQLFRFMISSKKIDLPKSLGIDDIRIKHKEDVIKLVWLKKLLNQKFISNLSNILFNRKWIVCVNNTDHPLFTSDHPVIKYNYENTSYGVGYAANEIIIPISSKYILITLCPVWAKKLNLKNQNCILSELKEDNLIFYNHLQVLHSYNYIFSQTDEFHMMKKFLESNPEASVPDRLRVRD